MPRRRPARGTTTAVPPVTPVNSDVPPAVAYAPTLHAGFQATASRVQEMHQAIAGKTFGTLLHVPGLAMPTRIVQGVHDAITQGVYAAVRHGGGAAFALAGGLERHLDDPARVPGGKEQAFRSALNGAVGDALAAAGSALAIQMGLHDRDGPLAPGRLASLPPRTCLFLHGLGCDEHSWRLRDDAAWAQTTDGAPVDNLTYGTLLERELGVGALWLRYNTGLAIEQNAQQLAELMQRTAAAAPQVREWVLIGHSMGGLVARRAQALAAEAGLEWAAQVPMIICLGSPHQGAPLEGLGHVAAAALDLTDVTRPLARVANARSRGIKDLRHGLKGASASASAPALRLVFATLGDEGDTGIGPLVGHLFGDGLVRAGSASADELSGDVQRVELAGLGHMGLLNHPRVYSVIRDWMRALAD